MMTSIRLFFATGIARWVLTLLILLLVASFGLWGIQDVFRGFRSDEVLRVGGTTVTAQEYQRAFNLQLRQESRRYGKVLTATEARLLGIDRDVLARVGGNAALDEQAKRFDLDLDDTKIAAVVMTDPSFQNAAGQFDRTVFASALRDNGLSEAGFVAQQRKIYLRGQFGNALTSGIAAPQVMREAFARFGSETRGIAYVTLTEASLGDIGQPDDAALKAYFGEHGSEFRTQEYRKVSYIALAPDTLAARAVVTDDDAKAEYDSRKDRFTTPEKRTVQQIAFPSAAEAAAAAQRIASGGATFDAVAAERKLSAADLELGTFTRGQMLDPEVGKAAFALAQGVPSGAVKGSLSNVILRVTKIEPEVVTPFDTAKVQIKKDIALDRARNDMTDLQGKIDDERSSGASLKEIAAKLKLDLVEVPAIDAQGRDPQGKEVALPVHDKLLPALFSGAPGADTDAVDGRDAGLVWYNVDAATPARDRTLDEARTEVAAAWTRDEKARRLKAKADDMLKAAAGRSLDDVAKEARLDVRQAWSIKRGGTAPSLSTAAVNQVFAVPVNGFATALAENGTDRLVLQVKDSTVPPYDAKADSAVSLDRQAGLSIEQDIQIEYVGRLQTDLGLSIDAANLARATGGSGGES